MTDLTTQAREMIERLEGKGDPMSETDVWEARLDAAALIRKLLAEREWRDMDRNELIEAMARALCDAEPATWRTDQFASTNNHWFHKAEAALAAIEAQGLAIVPVEATSKQIEGGHVFDPLGCDIEDVDAPTIYRRIYFGMIEAGKV